MPAEKELVAGGGLYGGDRPLRRGGVADPARDLRQKLREYRFDRVADAVPFPARISPTFAD
jgi:hypothetical protein